MAHCLLCLFCIDFDFGEIEPLTLTFLLLGHTKGQEGGLTSKQNKMKFKKGQLRNKDEILKTRRDKAKKQNFQKHRQNERMKKKGGGGGKSMGGGKGMGGKGKRR